MIGEVNPYESFTEEQRILRDELAIDRTILANERTFLAYVRTALALAVVGVSCFQFFNTGVYAMTGGVCIVGAAALLVFGIRRAHAVHRRISVARTPAKKS